jgi:hypothetical protein
MLNSLPQLAALTPHEDGFVFVLGVHFPLRQPAVFRILGDGLAVVSLHEGAVLGLIAAAGAQDDVLTGMGLAVAVAVDDGVAFCGFIAGGAAAPLANASVLIGHRPVHTFATVVAFARTNQMVFDWFAILVERYFYNRDTGHKFLLSV